MLHATVVNLPTSPEVCMRTSWVNIAKKLHIKHGSVYHCNFVSS